MIRQSTILCAVLCAAMSGQAFALQFSIDEWGNGGLPWQILPDPGPTGFPATLTYFLPFPGLQGDVLIAEPGVSLTSDLLRFNGNSTVVVYSDNLDQDPVPAPADIGLGPEVLYPNHIVLTESGDELINGVVYTPSPNQPGWDPSGPTYVFASDVPEPATHALLGVAAIGLAACARRRRKLAAAWSASSTTVSRRRGTRE